MEEKKKENYEYKNENAKQEISKRWLSLEKKEKENRISSKKSLSKKSRPINVEDQAI